MISLLGKIDLPSDVIQQITETQPDVYYRAPNTLKIEGRSESENENYKNYKEENSYTTRYENDFIKQIIPLDFFKSNNFNLPQKCIVTKQKPGVFTTPHYDKFTTLGQAFLETVDFDDIVRLWIPLEDSKFGHALFVESEVLHKFQAGEIYTFDNYDFHSGCNAGLEDRWTLIVYTTKNKD
jgi:hypothetical protein